MTEHEKHHDHAHNAHHEGAHHEHHEHKEHHEAEGKGKIMGMDSGSLVLAVSFLIIGLIVGSLVAFGMLSSMAPATQTSTQGTALGGGINVDELKVNVEKYINDNLLLDDTVSATITDANDMGGGLYELSFEIMQDGAKVSEGTLFANAKSLIIGQAFDLSKPVEQAPVDAGTFEKSDKPAVGLFIMSFCPYGIQAVEAFEPAVKLLEDNIDFSLNYVLYSGFASQYGADWNEYCFDEEETYCSMHGTGELNEDIRQMCIQKHQRDKLWTYMDLIVSEYNAGKVSASNIDSLWKGYAETAGVDVAAVESCVASEAEGLLAEQSLLNELYSVQGSPTALINEGLYSGGRTSEAFKTAICSAFNTQPADCNAALDSTAAAASGSC